MRTATATETRHDRALELRITAVFRARLRDAIRAAAGMHRAVALRPITAGGRLPDVRTVAELDPVALAASIDRLELRIAALEEAVAARRLPQAPQAAGPIPDEPRDLEPSGLDADDARATDWTLADTVTFSGRTLMALGGAYLLRALTDGGVMAPGVGVLAGLTYAATWMALCLRAANRAPSAVFHGLTAALIGFPLIAEASLRFKLWDASTGAVVLTLFTVALLLAARRAKLESVAWFAALGGTVTALLMAVGAAAFIPYTLVVAVTGVATLWLGYLNNWVLLRWPVAAAVNLMMALITLRAVTPQAAPATWETVALQLFVLGVYLASFVGRALFLGREVIAFEILQSAAVMTLCFGGALWVLSTAGVSAMPMGIVALVLGAGAYAFEFLYLGPRQQRRNGAFFTTLALAFTLAGVMLVLPRPAAAVVTATLALAFSEWARRAGRVSLAAHGMVFAGSVMVLSGLAGLAWAGLGASASHAWPSMTAPMLGALAIVVACGVWPVAAQPDGIDALACRALRIGRLALLVWVGAGVAAVMAVSLLTPPPGPGADAGVVATIRTVILLAFACALVCLPTRLSRREYAWVTYAFLGMIALKVVVEDLPQGRPGTLFAAFAAYGAALIAIPRLVRRSDRTPNPL
jgi:hypothetical protein